MSHTPYPLYHGDNMAILPKLIKQGVEVHSIVCDPPYGLSFMDKKWDHDVPQIEVWERCLEILKPGGHLVAFGGARTYHRMACNIEDAGFEIRDQLMWVYGQGFPKSHDVSKNIDKHFGASREIVGSRKGCGAGNVNILVRPYGNNNPDAKFCGAYMPGVPGRVAIDLPVTAPATAEAQRWSGWGTGLKPAMEPIVLARKPLAEKSVAVNVLQHEAGALNIDACRIGSDGGCKHTLPPRERQEKNTVFGKGLSGERSPYADGLGRWPANVIFDELAGAHLDGAQKFFYCPKVSKSERNGSKHPTMKPVALMRYLCKLVTPKRGWILDPFAGSGSTGEAALLEDFYPILIERESEYVAHAKQRLVRAYAERRAA